MDTEINTHGMVCDFGKHSGELYTRMPVGYLTWMVGANHSRAHIAAAELKRRGTTVPDLDVTGHAIDRASFCALRTWKDDRKKDEGLNSWLVRLCKEALEKTPEDDRKSGMKIHHKGLKLAFDFEGRWPVLKTVMPGRKKDRPLRCDDAAEDSTDNKSGK